MQFSGRVHANLQQQQQPVDRSLVVRAAHSRYSDFITFWDQRNSRRRRRDSLVTSCYRLTRAFHFLAVTFWISYIPVTRKYVATVISFETY